MELNATEAVWLQVRSLEAASDTILANLLAGDTAPKDESSPP